MSRDPKWCYVCDRPSHDCACCQDPAGPHAASACVSPRRQLAEQLAKAARYDAFESAIAAIEAALLDAETVGARAILDSWIVRVGERIAAELKEEAPVAKS